jgi:topoisomerase-4 subunit B
MTDSTDLFGDLPEPALRAPTPTAKPATPVPAASPQARPAPTTATYTAADIVVLEGLEPVRMRPGMYIGGTDEKALHHLFAEVIDNSMDEAVAGHATFIEVELDAQGFLSVTDNGRGIPVDPHPKFKDKSALEVILTTLHSGGKFDSKVYETSGGLHGVGVSVVNALSDFLEVEVALNRKLYRQTFARGIAQGKITELGDVHNRRGTKVRFPSGSADFRRRRQVRSIAALPHGALESLPVRRRRDPLDLRTGSPELEGLTTRKSGLPFPWWAERLSDGAIGF